MNPGRQFQMPFLTGMEDYPSHLNVIPTLKKLDEKLPLYYREMLDYFKELRVGHPDLHKSEFILWNNKEITIENKSIFWTHLSEQGICFVHDLLDNNGRFLSLENVQRKYNVHLNFFQYFQLIAAIPNYLKKNAQETAATSRDIRNERDVFYLSDNKAPYLTKLRCKDYYNFFQENNLKGPFAVKSGTRLFASFACSWKQIFNTIYKTTTDNKLRKFGF